MNHEATAILRWVPADRGGRAGGPPGSSIGYAAPARFENDRDPLAQWSVCILDARPLRGPEVVQARIRFLVDTAPRGLLAEGERFELREGERVVAKGVVLPERLAIPERLSDFELALLG